MTKKSFSSLKAGTKAKLASAAALASTALATSPVFADDDPFAKGQSAAQSITENLRNLAPYIFVVCFVIVGIMFSLGDTAQRKAMGWLPKIVAGIAIVAGAASLVLWISGLFN